MKNKIISFFALFLLILSGCGANQTSQGQKPVNATDLASNKAQESPKPAPEESLGQKVKEAVNNSVEAIQEGVAAVEQIQPQDSLPATFDQNMAFSRQAPFGNWDAVHEETCEEASLIIAQKFYQKLPLDEKIMDEELNKVLPWEKNRFGYDESTTAEETAIMAREYFNLKAEVSSDVTVERVKKELVAGNLIILPLAGQELHNPNYTGAGPVYHMLVVRGYDRDQFITNDPGTRKGQGYKYDYDVLLEAVHDWNGGDVPQGQKVMIIVGK